MSKEKSKKDQLFELSDNAIDVAAGAFSGMTATGVTYPMDTLTVRAQAANTGDAKKYHIPKASSKAKGLYKGIGWKMSKTIPAGAAGYWAYGAAKRKLKDAFGKEDNELEKNSALRRMAQAHPGPFMPNYAHVDEVDNVGKKNMRTGKAIKALANEWLDRLPPKGIEKEVRKPITKKASWAAAARFAPKALNAAKHFGKGMIGIGKSGKGLAKKTTYFSGMGTSIGAPMLASSSSKTLKNYGSYKPTKIKKSFDSLPNSNRVNTIK